VTQYAVAQSKGKLATAGDVYSVFLYGIPVVKGSALAPALQAGLQEMIADGSYQKILSDWGVQGGGITDITISGAQS
jgi:polar amino acid transport system substrate-binding protein